MTIKTIECTSKAYPTQYDIYLDDGRYVYFRYRSGRLYIQLEGKPIYEWYSDDPKGSKMSHDEVLKHLKLAGITLSS